MVFKTFVFKSLTGINSLKLFLSSSSTFLFNTCLAAVFTTALFTILLNKDIFLKARASPQKMKRICHSFHWPYELWTEVMKYMTLEESLSISSICAESYLAFIVSARGRKNLTNIEICTLLNQGIFLDKHDRDDCEKCHVCKKWFPSYEEYGDCEGCNIIVCDDCNDLNDEKFYIRSSCTECFDDFYCTKCINKSLNKKNNWPDVHRCVCDDDNFCKKHLKEHQEECWRLKVIYSNNTYEKKKEMLKAKYYDLDVYLNLVKLLNKVHSI